ncbi:hypothetical protein J27TS8_42240 [Robertmurraya siralis]|uniref:Uncharacterized protein n=2 Tax=Robertmurraya siralis TaxID=77777 RepID=A0A919WM47_9BACI|nr:hypothetical protein J27TS8_42240 [Robertmurraya siralis]
MTEKEIYILLTDTGTWFSRMIKMYTRFPYNHVSIALDQGLQNIYSFGRKVYTNPFSGGFVKERMDQGVFFHKKETKCVVYKLTVNEEQFNEIIQIIYQFERFSANYRYNLLGIFAIALNMKLKRDNAFTCSQFVATVLGMSGLKLMKKSPELMRPDDFALIPTLELIYEGKLHEYQNYVQPAPFPVRNVIGV